MRVVSARSRIESLNCSLEIDIWVKQPRRKTCESLIRACQAQQRDFEHFLAWFREHELGLLGPQLDCYTAEVLLGMHVSGGEIQLPGDMQNFVGLDEKQFYEAIVQRAIARKWRNENGATGLIRITAPGEKRSHRRSDAMAKALPVRMDENGNLAVRRVTDTRLGPTFQHLEAPQFAYLDEIDELFASAQVGERVLAAAIIRAANRELLERIGRAAGLTRDEARFVDKWGRGKVTKRDSESLYKSVTAKMPALRKAILDFSLGQTA
jgi:hypothetical protein